MPIRISNELPVKEILEAENIFVMDYDRSMHQDIRPLEIIILNLMPKKEDTELQLLRCLSNTPMQINISLLTCKTHQSINTSSMHLDKFYENFDDVKYKKFDGMIITGAPIELLDFEDVDFWNELCDIMEWTKTNVTSVLHLCWGAFAGLYYHYGIKKYTLDEKLVGIFLHKNLCGKSPLLRGFDDEFMAPHSRYTQIKKEDVEKIDELTILASSDEAGVLLIMDKTNKNIFMLGHLEYDRLTLDDEYKRDKHNMGDLAPKPKNYYPDDNEENTPILRWRANSNAFYSNWINYYIYQNTPYELG